MLIITFIWFNLACYRVFSQFTMSSGLSYTSHLIISGLHVLRVSFTNLHASLVWSLYSAMLIWQCWLVSDIAVTLTKLSSVNTYGYIKHKHVQISSFHIDICKGWLCKRDFIISSHSWQRHFLATLKLRIICEDTQRWKKPYNDTSIQYCCSALKT